ncbi:4-alpha-glucanotransferase [Sedimenticola selenatireducens]|uniref:4-alpha-glucanotransferase n=1 Tax=Sedimenticola selenatireducens TaxID=191960 RepID=UPI0004B614C2
MIDQISSERQSMDKSRCAGILLHPTSLPGPLSGGDIGHEAYRFVEFLHACGIKVWQMLPLCPPHEDLSPYQCFSAHAGNPALISLDWLVDRGWLDLEAIRQPQVNGRYRSICLEQAHDHFNQVPPDSEWKGRLQEFRLSSKSWLDDFCLFVGLKKRYGMKPWYLWPPGLRQRNKSALLQAASELSQEIDQAVFEQFVFFTQWREIREYAARYNVRIFGDMPIFVSHDSADVWANRENFQVNEDGSMTYVSGVPPDAFSPTGQKWGNPLYDWEYMQRDGFKWWKDRLATLLQLFDLIRVDHFRGLDACWEIPAEDETAINGHWRDVPGETLLKALHDCYPSLPLIAEDLGVITDRVHALKERFGLPGMKVLQFAFDGNSANPHLPHRHRHCDVVYTGTHDNDTTLGWIKDEEKYNKDFFLAYSGCRSDSAEEQMLAMLRMALSSVSFLCVLPMQDILLLDSSARMNTPGTVCGNWAWRFSWHQVNPERTEQITRLIALYQR